MTLPDILDRILAVKRREVDAAKARAPEKELREEAKKQPPPRGFIHALRRKIATGRPAVIAEIKRASPSKGVLRDDFAPERIAADYEAHGAACLSVITDREFFQGAPDFLRSARATCALPVLRKDFIVDPYQIAETRAMGADAILLIAAALDFERLKALEAEAFSFGLDVLVETHCPEEIDAALRLETPLVGINNRDLRTFGVDLQTTIDLFALLPPDRLAVTESGILTPDDVRRMREAGVGAFLVGEAFMRAKNPGEALEALFS
ncbi:MAG: indole-3-glycerol phosphate synthase TrpC [Candidatus Accumulibacter sp.]|jgi:indole-3-glycerol phosphate synthase|nr:indole-3-glycerol phosphate synthase TrpC [Accumulibacter sp.]